MKTVAVPDPANCQAIKTATPTSPSGVYSIDPDGTGGNASFQAYCDMTTLGGGWTLVMNLDTSDGNVMHYDNALWTNASSYGTVPSSLLNANDYKNGSAFTALAGSQLMVSVHAE
ncbi:MAG: fibrinogen-like YCDxxxxGGGW domain-containing protein [Patescibacteria group bacterium]